MSETDWTTLQYAQAERTRVTSELQAAQRDQDDATAARLQVELAQLDRTIIAAQRGDGRRDA